MIEALGQAGHTIPAAALRDSVDCHGHVESWVDWESIAKQLSSPVLGLELSGSIRLRAFNQLTYLAMSSPTLGHSLRRLVRYQGLINPRLGRLLDLQVRDRQAIVSFAEVPWHRSAHEIDFALGILHRLCGWLTGTHLVLQTVQLMHESTAGTEAYKAQWGCTPQFGQSLNALVFAAEELGRKSLHAEPELCRSVEAAAQRQLAAMHHCDLLTRLRQEIRKHLAKGASLDVVARALGVSRRTLQRRLSAAETSFHCVVDEERMRWSIEQVVGLQLSIPEIADRCGFANTSGFYRAFKRWTGETPAHYRARGQQSPSAS